MWLRIGMDTFNIGVEVWLAYWLMNVPDNRRFEQKWIRVPEYLMFFGVIGGVTLANRMLAGRFSNGLNVVQLVLGFTTFLIFTKYCVWKVLAWSAFYFVFVSVLELPGLVLCGWITGTPYLKCIGESHIYNYIYLVALSVFLLAAAKIRGRFVRTKLINLFNGKWNIMWIFLAVVEWFIITFFLHIGELDFGGDLFLFSLLFVCCVVMMLVIIMVLAAYQQADREMNAQKLHEAQLDVKYEKVKGEYVRRSKEMHDLKYQINILDGYLAKEQCEDARAFLKDMSEALFGNPSLAYTRIGNPVVDMVLESKIQKARHCSIAVEIDIAPLETPVSDRDMCILLGNLLDNAIEAALKAAPEKRYIYIRMRQNGNIIQMNFRNSISEPPRKKDGRLMTTKANAREHGFGLLSVQTIVNKYDGQLDISYNSEYFELSITIFS